MLLTIKDIQNKAFIFLNFFKLYMIKNITILKNFLKFKNIYIALRK